MPTNNTTNNWEIFKESMLPFKKYKKGNKIIKNGKSLFV